MDNCRTSTPPQFYNSEITSGLLSPDDAGMQRLLRAKPVGSSSGGGMLWPPPPPPPPPYFSDGYRRPSLGLMVQSVPLSMLGAAHINPGPFYCPEGTFRVPSPIPRVQPPPQAGPGAAAIGRPPLDRNHSPGRIADHAGTAAEAAQAQVAAQMALIQLLGPAGEAQDFSRGREGLMITPAPVQSYLGRDGGGSRRASWAPLDSRLPGISELSHWNLSQSFDDGLPASSGPSLGSSVASALDAPSTSSQVGPSNFIAVPAISSSSLQDCLATVSLIIGLMPCNAMPIKAKEGLKANALASI